MTAADATSGAGHAVTRPATPPPPSPRHRRPDAFSRGRPPSFQQMARTELRNSQLRRNLAVATSTIRRRRGERVAELDDWQQLREAGRALKERVLRHLDTYLLQLEEQVQRAGGHVHWARDAADANAIVARIVASHGAREVVKVKSLTTEEIKLNEALAKVGITAFETDLAELIVQLAGEGPSHILVPAIHKNRAEIRELFERTIGPRSLTDNPNELAAAARAYLRHKFLTTPVAVSGANFAIAETGTLSVFESEGNGRMCLTLPNVLVTVMGIEKVIPTWQDFEVFLQLLPRSSTGERMNPYTSLWSGVTPGDGPQEFHLVLLDSGRTNVLADPTGRQALYCIRCSACLNVCPVYERVGGYAYSSVYPGPIGAILTPQLVGLKKAGSLPYASSLCGACYEACPVKINIPQVLLHLRGNVVRHKQDHSLLGKAGPENVAMELLASIFADRQRYERAQEVARLGQWPIASGGTISWLPGPLAGWTAMRDLPALPRQSFRAWWRATHVDKP
jgi:L-lactate dehydrogenase complex protein LldF